VPLSAANWHGLSSALLYAWHCDMRVSPSTSPIDGWLGGCNFSQSTGVYLHPVQ